MNDPAVRAYARRTTRQARDQSQQLLEAATALLSNKATRHIAYSLCIAALEEIGKAEMIAMAAARDDFETVDEVANWLSNRADDHVDKLFWALWAPMFGRDAVRAFQLAREEETARNLHRARKNALYVSVARGGIAPSSTISAQQVKRMLKLVEARLAILGHRRFLKPDRETAAKASRFIQFTESDEGRAFAMSSPSMEKLAELGDVSEWMEWLDAQVAEAHQAAADVLASEKARSEITGKMKWRVKARLISPGLSIRSQALVPWNRGVHGIRLSPGSKNRVLHVELSLADDISVSALPHVASALLTRLALAFNIGALGFFSWDESRLQAAFCDSILDIENKIQVTAEAAEPGKVEWGRRRLERIDMRNVMLVMATMPAPDEPPYRALEHYRRAVACFAKSDVHLNLVPNGVDELRLAIDSALRDLGGWSGSGTRLDALDGHIGDVLKGLDQDDLELVEVADSRLVLKLERGMVLKTVADALFVRLFRVKAARRAAETRRSNPANPTTDGAK